MAKQQTNQQSSQKSEQKSEQKGFKINPAYMIGAASALSGITSMLEQRSKNQQYSMQANQYLAQKNTAALNERMAKMAAANAYTSGAYQAMMQGLRDAQEISQTRASRASSGVRLGTGSAREIEASQRINAAINQAQIQKQTIEAATNHMLDASNYQVQQVIAQGNANAANALKQNSWISGLTSFASSAVQYDNLWQDGGKNNSALFGWMDKYF